MSSYDRSPNHRARCAWVLALVWSAVLVLGAGCALADPSLGTTGHQVAGGSTDEPGRSYQRNSMARSFQPTDDGGIEQVVTRDPANQDQLDQARAYLRNEVARFQQGQYDDPAKAHGMEMPGSKALESGYGRIRVSYADLPSGGQVAYIASEAELVQALHAWFERRQMRGS